MAYTRLKTNKKGQRYYEIQVSRGRGKTPLYSRWYIPDGWSQKAIDRELAKQAAEFERQVNAGDILSRKEKVEAEAAAAEAAAKIQTVKDFGEKVFMPGLAVTCSENTRYSFQGNLKNHIYPVIGNIRMPEVTSAQINALLLSFQAKGKSHSSCIKLYTILNLLFKTAYMQDVIDRNPMDKVQRPKQAKADEGESEEVERYTDEETNYILDCLDLQVIHPKTGNVVYDTPLKWRAFVHLIADTGMRRGEALGLRWSAVDFDEDSVKILVTLNYSPDKGIIESSPKTGKARTVYPDPDVMKLLKELKESQSNGNITDINAARSGYVFSEDGITPMHPTSPTHFFRKFGERFNIDNFHPHKLRHTFASSAITNGSDIASVSEILGHADKSTTLRMYTHSDAEAQKRAAEIRRQALKAKREKAV